MMRLSGRRFRAGGYVLNVAAQTRVLVFSRQLNRPHEEIILDTIGPANQGSGSEIAPVEILLNGGHIFNEQMRYGVWEFDCFLSWLRIPAYGLLQVYLTNSNATTPFDLAVMLEGFYVKPREWA